MVLQLASAGTIRALPVTASRPSASNWSSRRGCLARHWRGSVQAQSSNKDELGELDAKLLEDLERLRQKSGQQGGAATPSSFGSSGNGAGAATSGQQQSSEGVKDLIDKVLIADFFFILFALAWFAVGLAQRSATQSTEVLDAWYSLWQWVFQPALGVLMLGAIASGLFEWVKSNLGDKN